LDLDHRDSRRTFVSAADKRAKKRPAQLTNTKSAGKSATSPDSSGDTTVPGWPWDPGADADDAWGNTFCAVLLLGKRGDEFGNGADSDETNGMLRERIGIGEVSEELLCELKDAGNAVWKDVYLQ
jgi:hypothetical protein